MYKMYKNYLIFYIVNKLLNNTINITYNFFQILIIYKCLVQNIMQMVIL